MQAIILAGGFGTRLKSVVKDVPKPMADINGAPFLSYLLTYLKKSGVTDVVISIGYLQEKIIQYFGNSFLGIKISYAREDKPLGTGGAILNSLKFIDQNKPVIVINGDTFLQVDYQKLLAAHKSKLTLVLRKMQDCSRYGRVVFDENFVIKSFAEKSAEKESGFINGGIYVLDPKIFAKFSLEEKFSFETDFLVKHLQDLEPQAFTVDEYFIDIGVPDDYVRAQKELPQLIKNKALFLDRDGVINIDYGHVFEIEKFHFIDGIFELCKHAQDLGYLIIVITNQAGIAKGFYTEEQFLELTKWMENEFAKRQIKISKTFYCPFHKEAKIEKYRQDSLDRKPNPGMLLKAIKEFNIDVEKSVMIGDKETDMMAAEAAKIKDRFLFVGKNLYDLKTDSFFLVA
ncbi:MAG: D-glycero-beta-D-manno-heptose 1,7-bisphosphate 7-phosphatase [Proteobacteria bacterium]|nr:D-glycero-beta-D-manno-heptose 1,7-bisphosphate 7-phosphatase [Pseudomonadota bacterium]